jgi:hypothetical protein
MFLTARGRAVELIIKSAGGSIQKAVNRRVTNRDVPEKAVTNMIFVYPRLLSAR